MRFIINHCVLCTFTVIFFYSCSSTGKLAIQIAVPSKNQISHDIKSIAILNRSMTSNFSNPQAYTIEPRLANEKFEKTYFDSIAADTAIKVAAREIFASQRFDVVVPLHLNILRNDSIRVLSPLDSVLINNVRQAYNVDAVLVLEYFDEKIIESKYRDSDDDDCGGFIYLSYHSLWRFYQTGIAKPVQSFQLDNFIRWECKGDYFIRKLSDRLPTIKEALISGGIAAGQNMSDQICPIWIDVERFYCITGKRRIDTAISLIKKNKWIEATEIWMKYASESDLSLRSKVEFNLALAAEMTDNLDQAIEWGNKSLKTKFSNKTELYLEELKHRRSLLEKINN